MTLCPRGEPEPWKKMTYCVALKLDRGLVFMSDTRTNAGVDKVATYRKMQSWCKPGERVMTLLSAGNLATTQAVISLLEERTLALEERDPSLMSTPTMFQAARIVGQTLREVIAEARGEGASGDSTFDATLILGGQIQGIEPRLFLIYPEGNFIEASAETPFFQIGETKYGRPILVRAFSPDLTFEDAVKLLCLSFDSTIKANLSVGMPLDVQVIETDRLDLLHQRRIEQDDAYFVQLSEMFSEAMKDAFASLPAFRFE